ncbi:DNA repair protein RadC [Porifericola rhodea]|uniref:RadC family protein n=1 Tax=Porifericola rhodea TaxID=930972 RepID=UPI0026666B85|nr:DNA repair protein RadC [Porifericola rhodea]WKN33443.1 DNA repair protein RadC [Porifericola rhodea]
MANRYAFREKGILSWAEEDRPREKLLTRGRTALTDAELIAILIGSGTRNKSAVDLSKEILASVNYNLHELAKLTVSDLQKFDGIGEAKAISIVSALELGRRRKEVEPLKREKITCSEDAYRVVQPYLMDQAVEQFWIILLNRANLVIKPELISEGGVSGTVADPKVIFKKALDKLASSIILVHNHPSGNLTPSQADLQLTRKLKEAGKSLDLPVLDHLIFTDHAYYSFADEGML